MVGESWDVFKKRVLVAQKFTVGTLSENLRGGGVTAPLPTPIANTVLICRSWAHSNVPTITELYFRENEKVLQNNYV